MGSSAGIFIGSNAIERLSPHFQQGPWFIVAFLACVSAAGFWGLGGFLLSCMGYDPADRSPLALRVMRGGGLVALLFLASLLITLALRGAQRRRAHGRTP